MRSKKMGKFVISGALIENNPDDVMRLMGRMIVVRAEFIYGPNVVEYTAISDYFEEVEEGLVLPEYQFAFSGNDILPEKIN